jgi:hypothetical protein
MKMPKKPKMPKMPKLPDPIDIIDDVVDVVVDPITDVVNDTVDFAQSLVNDTTKAVKHTTQICASQAVEYSKQGFDVASDTWKQGTEATIAAVSNGVEIVEYASMEAYKWLDANACYLGLNLALTTGCVAYFTPKPSPADPGTVTSAAISTTYLSYIAVQGSNLAMSIAIAKIITEGIILIPGVKGNVDEKMLYNVICNTIATCNPVVLSLSLATPAGVGIFIGSVISPIVAQLVCEKIAPKGFKEAL